MENDTLLVFKFFLFQRLPRIKKATNVNFVSHEKRLVCIQIDVDVNK